MESRNREWMYCRIENGYVRREFMNGLSEFMSFAKTYCRTFFTEGVIRCPCFKCRNIPYLDCDTVEDHIMRRGFVPGYQCWTEHGENEHDTYDHHNVGEGPSNAMGDQYDHEERHEDCLTSYHEMVHDLAGPSFNWN